MRGRISVHINMLDTRDDCWKTTVMMNAGSVTMLSSIICFFVYSLCGLSERLLRVIHHVINSFLVTCGKQKQGLKTMLSHRLTKVKTIYAWGRYMEQPGLEGYFQCCVCVCVCTATLVRTTV